MKRNLVSAALALSLVLPFAGSVAFAQAPVDPAAQNGAQPAPQPRHMPNPHHQAMKLSRELNLTPDQTAKLEPILAERQQKMAAVKADTTLTPDQAHQQMKAIMKNTHAELAGVLTPDQMQQMKAMHRAHEQKMNGAAPTGV